MNRGVRDDAQHTGANLRLPAAKHLVRRRIGQFKRAYVFSLTASRLTPNLARLSTYRGIADVGSIYLIRHGQASFGADDYDVLSPLGERQAQIVGQHLVDLGVSFDRCVSGDLTRQQDTARHALEQFSAAGLARPTLEVDAAFNEFDAFGVLKALLPGLLPDEPHAVAAMTNAAHDPVEFQRIYDLIVARWLSGTWDTPELESWLAFVERVQGGLNRLLDHAHDTQHTIAVFTSGGTITALLHLLTRIPANDAFKLTWQIANTSLSRLKFQGREVTLASFNSHVHLQLLKTPSLITYR